MKLLFAILILVFLFKGEPDLWDKWHDAAMHWPVCERSGK